MTFINKYRMPLLGLAFLLSLLSIPLFSIISSAANNCGYTDPEPYGVNVCNVNGHQLNYELWKDTGIEAYGKWDEVKNIYKNDFKPQHQLDTNPPQLLDNEGYYKEGSGYAGYGSGVGYGEYRYHGWDYNGQKYENIYFPNDANADNDDLSKRRWIYEPWANGLSVPQEPIDLVNSNDNAGKFQQYLQLYLIDRQGVGFTNAIQLPNSTPPNRNPINYLYVHQEPDLRSVGSGTMWHKSASTGKIWYQTFNMPTVGERNLTDVEAEIQVLDTEPIKRGNFNAESVIPVKVKVVGTLKDETYYNSDANEFAFYTRKDIESWTISIGSEQDGNFQEKVKVEPVKNTGAAQFTLLVPVNKIDEINQTYLANAKATVHFYKDRDSRMEKSNWGRTSREIQFSGESKELFSLFTIRNAIDFDKASTYTSGLVNYMDASAGEIIRYDITITNTDSGERRSLAYTTDQVDDATVQTELHTFMKSHFPDETVLVKRQQDFLVEQTITIKNGKQDTHSEMVVVTQHPENKAPSIPGGGTDGETIFFDPPVYVNPDLQVPQHGFDIVGVSMSDHTDMSTVASRSCFVDGVSVSSSELFSGNYVFGIGNHGFHQVRCDYVSTDGMEASQIEWIKIWDTKPKAQYKMYGPYKENRKMIIDDDSVAANDAFVINNYPISNYNWHITTLEGSPLKFDTNTTLTKAFLSNSPGVYEATLTVTNTLGRVSDPYTVRFRIVEDIEPSVILHPYDSQIARGEKVRLMYDAVSVDGDQVGVQKVEVFYDSNNDGTYDQLLETIDPSTGLTEYIPPNKLGKYKLVGTVDEIFGEETISSLLDGTEKRTRVVETWFEVDNYQPTSAVYIDIPIVLPQIDSFFMLDKNLTQTKIDYVKNNKVTISNNMRDEYMDPTVDTWDMKTYTYSTPASTTRNTGTRYPPSSTYYASGGYSGKLSRYDVRNDPYQVDEGSYKTKTESKTATDSCSNTVSYDVVDGSQTNKTESNPCPSSKSYSDSEGYSGTLSRTSTTKTSGSCSSPDADGNYSCTDTWVASYSGTVSRTVTYWESNWVTYDDYTGYYSGTIYKDVRQPYDNSFFRTTSDKYVVYISDSNVNEIWDLQMVMENNDAKLILVGQEAMKSQIAYEHFILNNKPIEDIVQDVVAYIAENNPSIPKYYTLINEPFNLFFAQYDDENDPIISDETMYIQDVNYYDNSLGQSSFAINAYDEPAWKNASKLNTFDKVGKYTIMRRVKDQPSTDPAFAEYSYYSNQAKIDIFSHRKPIAEAVLDWDYDPNRNVYLTTWIDESYDLDHQYSDPEKGIRERKIKYKKSTDSTWVYKIPDELEPGTYDLYYLVKDIEGAWSDPFLMNFTLANAPEVQLDAKAKTTLTRFSMNSIPVTEQLQLYDVWTRYPYAIYLDVALFQNGSRKTPTKRIYYSSSTGTKSGNDINWNDIYYTIPSTLPDGAYQLKITGVGQGGMTSYKQFNVQVKTPINLQIVDFLSEMTTREAYDIKSSTTKYANNVKVMMFKGTSYQTTLTLNGTRSGYDKSWIKNYTIPSIPDGMYTIEYRASTPNGNSETKTKQIKITNNRPPVAGFTISPNPIWEGDTVQISSTAYDPDPNDDLTYTYILTDPDGRAQIFRVEHPTFRVLQVGTYTLKQTVTDKYDKTDSITKTFDVGELRITGNVYHTDEWQDTHNKIGNNANEFYSGERFMLQSNVTNHEIEYVHVYFEGKQADGETLRLTTHLSPTTNSVWTGNLYDKKMTEPKTRLEEGSVRFVFTVKYKNGIKKKDIGYVKIIGSVYDALDYHRSY